MIDVSPHQLEIIEKILQKHVPNCEVRVFGSRATWTAKDYSDLDLAIVDKEELPGGVVFSMKEAFQESDLPFRVDVLDWNAISKEFRKVIEKKYEVIQKAAGASKKGEILKGWVKSLIGDHIELVYGNGLPERDRKGGKYLVYGSNGVVGSHDRALVKGPGIIIGRKGTVGQVTLSKSDFWPIDTTYYVKLKEDGDIFFWFYLLQTLGLSQMNSHSAVPGLNRDNVYSILKQIPTPKEQRAIAKILFDLDEKIELNCQMNKTLEAIAQAFFKRWFVDFKFPGHEKAKFVNTLPVGWHQGTLSEIVTIESGKRPGEKSEIKTDDFNVPLIGASSVMGFVKDALYKDPILIIGRVGTHGIVQRVSCPSFPSDNTLVIRSKYFEYVYQILKTIDYESLNVGTTQPLITQTAMKNYSSLIPSIDVLEKFEACVSYLFEKIIENNLESDSLVGIRDSLLPKLMSGKIRIN